MTGQQWDDTYVFYKGECNCLPYRWARMHDYKRD